MDNIKLLAYTEQRINDSDTNNTDIEPGYCDGI